MNVIEAVKTAAGAVTAMFTSKPGPRKRGTVVVWDPSQGQACQGDVSLTILPDEIRWRPGKAMVGGPGKIGNDPTTGAVVLALGEATGHHHAIRLPQPTMYHDEALARTLAPVVAPTPKAEATAALYEDAGVKDQMVQRGYFFPNFPTIGLLEVENGPVILRHDEHDPIQIPPGRYIIGAQLEHTGVEITQVVD